MGRIDTASKMEAQFQDQLSVARRFFEPQLRGLGLSEDQIEKQTLDELKVSLDRVNDAIQHPESFGTLKLRMTANTGAIIVQAESEAHIEVGVLPILLERKRLIIDRIRLLTPQEQIRDFRDEIVEKVEDPTIRSQLLQVLEQKEAEQQAFAVQIEKESEKVDQAWVEAQRLKVELQERRWGLYRTFLERESVATIIGAILLLALTGTLVVAMFMSVPASEVVTNSFLIILGYFFGQSVGRRGAAQ